MTDSKNDSGKGFPKKPAPIIDLKATVVETAKPVVDTAKAVAAEAAKIAASEPAKTVASAAAAAASSASTSVPGSSPGSKPVEAKSAPPGSGPTSSAASAGAAHSRPTPPSPLATAAKPAGGFFTHMAAGLTGAIMAIAGSQFLELGLNSGGNAAPSPDLVRRLAALEQSAAKPSNSPADAQKFAAADTRLQKLEEAAQALANGQVKIATEAKAIEERLTGQGAQSATTTGGDAATRIAKLEEQLTSMAAASSADPRNAGRIQQLAEMTGKLREVETALVTRTAQLKTELTQQMDQRLAKASEQTETARSLLAGRTQSVEQTLKSVTDETTALRSGVDALKADVDTRFRTAAKPADIQTAIAPVTTKLAQLETNMASVVRSEQERNATAGNILLSLELANLKRALDRGGKYASELAAVNKLAGGKLDLVVLERQQEVGVPSLAALGQELAGVAHAMLDAEAEPADATFGDRMLSGLKSVVRVRKVDHAPGDKSTEALIARMETGLKEGRIADVIEASKTLPPKAAAPAAKWLTRIEQRAQIDKALGDLDAGLKTSLAGGAQPKKGTN